jgi:hypothetical protein
LGWIQQRPKEVENGTLATVSTEFSGRSDVLERRVVMRREEERKMMLAQSSSGFKRWQIDSHSEGFQNIRAARLRSDGAIAVLGDGYAGRGANDCDRRRNIESIKPVSTRAANIQDFSRAGFEVNGGPNGFFA